MLVSKHTKLHYKNMRNAEITLSPLTDYFLVTCNETISNNLHSNKIRYLDGEHFDNSTLGIRHIEIFGFFNTFTNRREMKRHMERTFNMGLEGILTYTRINYDLVEDVNLIQDIEEITERYTINCRLEELPEIVFNPETDRVEFTITLICFNPYWIGKSITENITTLTKLGKFPLIIPPEKFMFGYRTDNLQSKFNNQSDARTGAVYTIKAQGGTVTNPSIKHDTGKTVKIFYHLLKKESITIVSKPDFVSVTINKIDGSKINGMQYLTDPTKRQFFMLEFGENTISYNADLNVTNLAIFVEYIPLYLGVH